MSIASVATAIASATLAAVNTAWYASTHRPLNLGLVVLGVLLTWVNVEVGKAEGRKR